MEFKGTKGVWEASPQNGTKNHCFCAQIFCDDKSLAIIESTDNPEEATANAKLIACAPEMLEMLNRCNHINSIAREYISEKLFEDLDKLITKATT